MPFRWDLVGPDQIGTLLSGTTQPDLWFLPELLDRTGKVLARSGNGGLYFVGRSLDSMFDLLGGALTGMEHGPDVHRLPFSFARGNDSISATHLARAREVCAAAGLDPYSLVRRRRPVTFVDVVSEGETFGELFALLADWLDERREPWNVARRVLRFVGVTIRRGHGPDTWRWQQHAGWPALLPASSVRNVSMAWPEWDYFGNYQRKLTRSYRVDRWLAEPDGPDHGDKTRQALAEAIAVSQAGRSSGGRRAIARGISGEPDLAQPWLRAIVRGLTGRGPPGGPGIAAGGVGHAPRSRLVRPCHGADRRKVGNRTPVAAPSARQWPADPGTLRIPVMNVRRSGGPR